MAGAQTSTACWVWCSVDKNQDKQFRHPAAVPADDEAAAKAAFIDLIRGPKLARISPATMLQTKGNLALIAERGATREVPKYMVLPWYEGLLILEELESSQGQPGHINATWWDEELRQVLDKERGKFQTGRLNGTLYTEKRLLSIAVTGARFVDADDREWVFRRENVKGEERPGFTEEGEDEGGFYKIREITNYLPPWEAFHHEKCGFYQDFYQVCWGAPFSEVDYSAVENGCTSQIGATWEPDECLPAHLDHLRVTAKRNWIKKRREQEIKSAAEEKAKAGATLPQGIKRKDTPPQGGSATPSPPSLAIKKEKTDDLLGGGPPAKMARIRRDGAPLQRDLLRSRIGHDFAPETIEQTLGQIRSGWPKQPQDYPEGFGVAGPPGFCWADCDCMDDQRPQRSWETRKAWLEDPTRSSQALTAINAFSEQTHFVRRRGQVSKMCFFETAQLKQPDQTHTKAALELAQSLERTMQAVLGQIPATALWNESDPVRIPARAFLSEDGDYEPLRFSASQAGSAAALPSWVRLDTDDGRLTLLRQPDMSVLPLSVRVDLAHAEGHVGTAQCNITAERFTGPNQPWLMATGPLALRFSDTTRCPLERGVRAALAEHFADLYDFSRRTPRDKSLGAWLDAMTRVLRLLRSAAGAGLALAPPVPNGRLAMSMPPSHTAPRTPQG